MSLFHLKNKHNLTKSSFGPHLPLYTIANIILLQEILLKQLYVSIFSTTSPPIILPPTSPLLSCHPVHGAALCTHPSQPGSAASPKIWISSVFIQFRDESSCQDPAVGPLGPRARNELQTLQSSFGTRSLKRWSYPEFTEK